MILELSVIGAFLVIIFFVYRFVTRDDRVDTEKQAFLDEVKEMSGVSVPEAEIRDYDEKREDSYKLVMAIRKKFAQRLDAAVDPKKPPVFPEERMKNLTKEQVKTLDDEFNMVDFVQGEWMKELGPNDSRVLKSALVARAMANLPRYELTRSEVMGRFELFKRQLISEAQWNDTAALNQQMVEEINFIKKEAELLETGFGNEIFMIASRLRKQAEEHMQMMQAQQVHAARAKMMGMAPRKMQDGDDDEESSEEETGEGLRARVAPKKK